MACRRCSHCGARWIGGQLYWATGKQGRDIDLAGLVCNSQPDEAACINAARGQEGGDSWAARARELERISRRFEIEHQIERKWEDEAA